MLDPSTLLSFLHSKSHTPSLNFFLQGRLQVPSDLEDQSEPAPVPGAAKRPHASGRSLLLGLLQVGRRRLRRLHLGLQRALHPPIQYSLSLPHTFPWKCPSHSLFLVELEVTATP